VRPKHNLILAVVLICLIGYYLAFEYSPSEETEPIYRGTPIYLVEPWNVKRVHVIETGEGQEVVFERSREGWTLVKGKEDVPRFETFLNDFVETLLRTVEIDSVGVEGKNVCDFGLDRPSYLVTITDATDKTYNLLVGGRTPVGTCVYAQFTDATKILVVGALLNYELGKLDRFMLPIEG